MEKEGTPRRGDGRQRLLAASVRLLDAATFDDVLAFVTVQRLSAESGMSNGAIYKAFRGPRAAARQAVVAAAIDPGEPTAELRAAIGEFLAEHSNGSDITVAPIARVLAADIESWSRGEGRASFTARLLSIATAVNEPTNAATITQFYRDVNGGFVPVIDGLLSLTGLEPVDEFDTYKMAWVLHALGDGLALRSRIDPSVGGNAVIDAILALWAGMTRKVGVLDDNLEGRVEPGRLADRSDASAAIESAVRRLYRRRGWDGVTIGDVANESGLSRNTVRAHVGERDRLAIAVWIQFLPALQRAVDHGQRLAVRTRVERYLTVVAEHAYQHQALTEALLRTFSLPVPRTSTGRARSTYWNPRDRVPIDQVLATDLVKHRRSLRDDAVRTPDDMGELATFLSDSVMRWVAAHPHRSPSDAAAFVTGVCLNGVLVRRR